MQGPGLPSAVAWMGFSCPPTVVRFIPRLQAVLMVLSITGFGMENDLVQ